MTDSKLITIKAKELTDKPTLDEEFKMVIGTFFQEIGELRQDVHKLKQELEELKKRCENEKSRTPSSL